jgi:hypothetical protein
MLPLVSANRRLSADMRLSRHGRYREERTEPETERHTQQVATRHRSSQETSKNQ